MAVIANSQRVLKVVGQRLKPAEMIAPLIVAEIAEPDRFGPALVAIAQHVIRKRRRFHSIIKGRAGFIAKSAKSNFRLIIIRQDSGPF